MNILTRVYQKIFPSQAGKRIKKWELSGLEDARYIYDLDENSIVFDLGAYKGEWSSQIYAMYSPKIYLFEPVPLFFNR
jgi:hypothetical protein